LLSRSVYPGILGGYEKSIKIQAQMKKLYAGMEEHDSKITKSQMDAVFEYALIGEVLSGLYLTFDTDTKKQSLELFFKTLEIRNGKLIIEYSDMASNLLPPSRKHRNLETSGGRLVKGLVAYREIKSSFGGVKRTYLELSEKELMERIIKMANLIRSRGLESSIKSLYKKIVPKAKNFKAKTSV